MGSNCLPVEFRNVASKMRRKMAKYFIINSTNMWHTFVIFFTSNLSIYDKVPRVT